MGKIESVAMLVEQGADLEIADKVRTLKDVCS